MPSVTQRMPFTLHESLIAASNCNSCCSLPSAQQSLLYLISFRIPTRLIGGSVFSRFHGVRNLQGPLYFFPWMFISVPGTATSQMNVHAVMKYNGYMGGRMLLFVNASLTRGNGDELCCACEE